MYKTILSESKAGGESLISSMRMLTGTELLSAGEPRSMAKASSSYVATDSRSKPLLVRMTPLVGSMTKEPSSRSFSLRV